MVEEVEEMIERVGDDRVPMPVMSVSPAGEGRGPGR